ncbi:hypothetical protein HK44_020490 [Pseudomonas fluorescens HK44]|uniref:CopG family transcriptional regulator n=1 Tax=Pseudomonas fluorescens HK44 TaxID=1042209 RepID=A0A010SYJ2_PSEFL|nr:hypothetical protein [Pseudomonas fluorescens]EXF95778.1 hypothetical protein HK44_020490 [Pseudomonas fluorescens HK44]
MSAVTAVGQCKQDEKDALECLADEMGISAVDFFDQLLAGAEEAAQRRAARRAAKTITEALGGNVLPFGPVK